MNYDELLEEYVQRGTIEVKDVVAFVTGEGQPILPNEEELDKFMSLIDPIQLNQELAPDDINDIVDKEYALQCAIIEMTAGPSTISKASILRLWKLAQDVKNLKSV